MLLLCPLTIFLQPYCDQMKSGQHFVGPCRNNFLKYRRAFLFITSKIVNWNRPSVVEVLCNSWAMWHPQGRGSYPMFRFWNLISPFSPHQASEPAKHIYTMIKTYTMHKLWRFDSLTPISFLVTSFWAMRSGNPRPPLRQTPPDITLKTLNETRMNVTLVYKLSNHIVTHLNFMRENK